MFDRRSRDKTTKSRRGAKQNVPYLRKSLVDKVTRSEERKQWLWWRQGKGQWSIWDNRRPWSESTNILITEKRGACDQRRGGEGVRNFRGGIQQQRVLYKGVARDDVSEMSYHTGTHAQIWRWLRRRKKCYRKIKHNKWQALSFW